MVLLAGCTGTAQLEATESPSTQPSATAEAPTPPNEDATSGPPTERAPDTEPAPEVYVPAGRPGSADAYAAMIERLDDLVPADLRNQVPWPDLRNPNPIVAQIEIFDLWIWMTENLPEPQLVEVMAAPGSHSRAEIVGIFGDLDERGHLERRPGAPYQAFDHVMVTFESAGLPLWLGRDVPADAVVVYYSDNSGPVDVIDEETGAIVDSYQAVGTRAWLSIMVPTDVGWQLWRDQLIEPNDSELETPDLPPPPGAETEQRKPEV